MMRSYSTACSIWVHILSSHIYPSAHLLQVKHIAPVQHADDFSRAGQTCCLATCGVCWGLE